MIAIREADTVLERNVIVETLSHYLNPAADGRRFDWLYRDNPYGRARVWLASDSSNQTIVGLASAFPRKLYVGAREVTAWVLGDFCINDRYRSLGPALQLQRALLEHVDSDTVTFCYDFPSPSMLAVYKRLHISPLGQMLRLAKPLRIDRKIRERFKNPIMARALSVGGNMLLGLSDSIRTERDSVSIGFHEGACGEEFSALSRQVGGRYGISVERSAEYLNWRYLANTYCHYELLTARRDGELVAYAFFTQNGEDAVLGDLFGIQHTAAITALVRRLIVLLRDRGVVSVSVPIMESHPWIPLLRSEGFIIREAKPVVVYSSKSRGCDGMNWCFMHGDRDS